MAQPNIPDRSPPARATGGCLCGAIRYTILFPPGHDFVSNSLKCLCTACRKQSGALLLHLHAVPLSAFSCVAPPAALGDYSAMPGCHRLFCRLCGSYLAWQQDARPGSVEGQVDICVGTLDEEFLVGVRGADRNVLPGTGFGALVAHPRGRVLWGMNEVVGATDGVPGRRFRCGTDSH